MRFIEEIDELISKSSHDEALKLIDKSLTNHETNNNYLLLKKAQVQLQIGIFLMFTFEPVSTRNDLFGKAYDLLIQMEENSEEISIKKKLLLLKHYYYPYKSIERADLFDQLKNINFEEFIHLKSIYLREKANELVKVDFNEHVNGIIKLYLESLEISRKLNQFNEYSETLMELIQKISFQYNLDLIDYEKFNNWFIKSQNLLDPNRSKIIEVEILITFTWGFLESNELKSCIELNHRVKLLLDKFTIPDSLICDHYQIAGHIEASRGNYSIAIKLFKKSFVENIPERVKFHIHGYIARAYYQLSDLENTFKYLKTSLYSENRLAWVQFTYFLYAEKLDDSKLLDEVYKKTMLTFENYPHKQFGKESNYNIVWKLLCQGLMKKRSDRLRDKMKAQEIFEEIVQKNKILPENYYLAILNLIDLLLYELKISGDIDLIQNIKGYIAIFENYLEPSNNRFMIVELFILKSRLNFLELNFDRALAELTKGKAYAKKNDMSDYDEIIEKEISLLKLEYEKIKLLTVDNKNDVKQIAENLNLDNLIGKIINKRKETDKELIKNYLQVAKQFADNIQ